MSHLLLSPWVIGGLTLPVVVRIRLLPRLARLAASATTRSVR